MTPAFKEWHAIVEALGAGAQTIILRKGGIAEGRGGFRVAANRFWLFPTEFHAQREKTKPTAAPFYPAASGPAASTVTLRFFAHLVESAFVGDWSTIAGLDPYHLWTEATVRERFDWAKPPGLHVFIVRVHRLSEPIIIEATPEMAGCKSWVELPVSPAEVECAPVLSNEEFTAKTRPILARLGI
jgi:hypothetical protein